MTDVRALCAELLSEIDAGRAAVLNRVTVKLRAALGEPEPGEPSDQEIFDLWDKEAEYYALYGEAWRFAHAVLTRWGRPAPAPKPIPVSERLPEDADCLVITAYDGTSSFDEHYCYLAKEFKHCGQVLLIWELKPASALKLDLPFTYWLPATTRFLPTTVDPAQPT